MMHRSLTKALSTTKRVTHPNVVKALMTSNSKFCQMPQFSAVSQSIARKSFLMGSPIQMRMFSSYPDHLKMEMPNLSPTMEKVSQSF